MYVTINVVMKPNWQILIELANASGNNDFENDNCGQTFDFHNSKKIEEIIEKKSRENIGTKHIEF